MALLDTKLHPPASRRRLVARPRLVSRLPLPSGPLPRLVLVSAPAGLGKTTVVGQWLSHWTSGASGAPCDVAWLSLDPEDSDPQRFLAHLLAAVGHARPGAAAATAALLESPGPAATSSVLVSLVNDLDGLAEPLLLALDDYHIVESPEVHEAMAFLLDHLPAHVTTAITTRADPPLALGRLRARGELVELRAADLRFTVDEATAFLNDVMGLDLGPQDVEALERRTEGWAAGLQLAALSLQGRDDTGAFIADFTGSHRFVLDYLVEEVLDRQPVDVRTFLLDTALLHELMVPLCDAVTGRRDGRDMLERLDRGNLFVVPLDDRRERYRYHHLFADALRTRLEVERPDRADDLHRAAARWYGAAGRPAEGIAHAIAGHDHEHAAELVEQAMPEASRQRQDRTLRRWVGSLPDAVVRDRPVLSVVAGWERLGVGDVPGAEAWLHDAEASWEALPPVERDATDELRQLPMRVAMYRAAVAQARGDTTGTARQARRVLELARPDDHLARGAGGGFLGLALWSEGDLEAAIDTFSRARRELRAAGNITDELGSTVVLAAMWLAHGRPAEAVRLLEGALTSATERPHVALPVAGDLHVSLAEALLELGDLPAAAEHLETAREIGEAGSLPENRHRWYVVMAAVRQAEGDLDAAADLLEQAQALHLPGFFPEVRPIPTLRARVDLARGHLGGAEAWARDRGVSATDEPRYLAELDHLTLARLLVAQQRPAEALGLLDRLRAAAEEAGRRRSLAEIAEVSALARQVGHGPPHQGLPEPLSGRELEVLRLLATELTGPAIASRLFVSVNTLRTHTRHIFTKLDVTTRAAAVRRARELHLL